VVPPGTKRERQLEAEHQLVQYNAKARGQMMRVATYQAPEVEWLAYDLPVIEESELAKLQGYEKLD
jgi:hypothetical protein